MKLAVVLDRTEDLRGQFATDSEGRSVPLGALHDLREIAFSDIEKDPGKGHFSREEAEEIVRNIPLGYRVEQSPFPGFFCVVKDVD